MSGRIWVVEENLGSRTNPSWYVMESWTTVPVARSTRQLARKEQAKAKALGYASRVMQYVRQGGAR